MKKLILVSCFSLLVSSYFSPPALAVDRPTLSPQAKETRMDVRKDNRKANLEMVTKRLRQGIVNRYENTLNHKTRIEARIAKIEELNKTSTKKRDLTAAKAKLATFNDAKYKADLALFDAKAREVMASSTPMKLTPELKTLAKNLNGDLKDLRSILSDTLRLVINAKK